MRQQRVRADLAALARERRRFKKKKKKKKKRHKKLTSFTHFRVLRHRNSAVQRHQSGAAAVPPLQGVRVTGLLVPSSECCVRPGASPGGCSYKEGMSRGACA